ncbi:hypothetical protein ANN_01939 [Periplaneta americana]|uniref:F-box domain-containing protein n=1 Tax=Periplaneta americana TaxID=6978 RepID=A0ABQ8TXV8_PERAM|nr:hypothetical protein ANN_01939 [Periplaneta americana]
MDTTPRKRFKIITLAEHSSMTQRQIAAECHISLATINSIMKRYRETGSITPQKKGNCGRKKKTSPADDRLIVRKSKLNPRLTAVDLTCELMATTGVNIHVTTVRRRLLEAGRRARKPIKKQLLTPVMCKKRLMWEKLHQHWTVNDWKNVLFSDESHFEVHGHRVSYVRKGSEKVTAAHLQQAPKYPPKVMFRGCFTHEGPGALIPIKGMMNSDKYIHLLETRIVPQLQKSFPDGRAFKNSMDEKEKSPWMLFCEVVLKFLGNKDPNYRNIVANMLAAYKEFGCNNVIQMAIVSVWCLIYSSVGGKMIELLPNEVMLEIFSYLDVIDLALSVQHVNSRWKELSRVRKLWKNKVFVPDDTMLDRDRVNIIKNMPCLRAYVSTRGRNTELIINALCTYCEDIEHLDLDESHTLEYPLLVKLTNCFSNIKKLIIPCLIEDNQLEFFQLISSLQNLTHLGFTDRYETVENGVLKPIADGCPSLQHMDLGDNEFKDEDVRYFLTKKQTQLLSFRVECYISLETFKCIIQCKNLEHLHYSSFYGCSGIASNEFTFIRNLKNLKTLILRHLSHIEIMAVPTLFEAGSLSKITKLVFDAYDLSSVLKNCPQLIELHVSGSDHVLEEGFKHIGNCKNLRYLTLSGCPEVLGKCLEHVATGCPNLRDLNLSSFVDLNDSLLPTLRKCKSLRVLHVSNYGFRGFTFELIPSYLGHVKELIIYGGRVEDELWDRLLHEMPHLKLRRRYIDSDSDSGSDNNSNSDSDSDSDSYSNSDSDSDSYSHSDNDGDDYIDVQSVSWLADEPREFNLPTLPQRCITYEAEKLPSKYGVHSEEYVPIRTDYFFFSLTTYVHVTPLNTQIQHTVRVHVLLCSYRGTAAATGSCTLEHTLFSDGSGSEKYYVPNNSSEITVTSGDESESLSRSNERYSTLLFTIDK